MHEVHESLSSIFKSNAKHMVVSPFLIYKEGGWEMRKTNMEKKVKECLDLTTDESDAVSQLVFPAYRDGSGPSLYEYFATTGIEVDKVEPGLVVCTLKVPPRLTDRGGNMANGAIANLVDVVGASVAYIDGLPLNLSVNICISYLSAAKLHDELEITSRVLGRIGGTISGTLVTLRNKATGEIIAEGRHTLFPHFSPKL